MIPQCLDCKHRFPHETGKPMHCAALPEKIPVIILKNRHDHREPYPGDNGIRFEPVPVAKRLRKTKAK